MSESDVLIVGGGIVGLATAYQLTRLHPDLSVVVLEKEERVAAHQTGHNSGVLHSGIYYKPGSLKAINCREGKLAMEAFCRQHDIAHDVCGKVIVAVQDKELPALERIFERGQKNGVRCEMIGRERLAELEPHSAGIKAIHVPEAGIVNYREVCDRLAALVNQHGGHVLTGTRVTRVDQRADEVIVESTSGTYAAKYMVNCAGLHCDRVTKLTGQDPESRIVPFRGEFYVLKPAARHLCRNLIYPVPNPSFPFLGVHFTRMVDGTVECGPNAVLAFAREGYRKRDINLYDMFESLTYSGFLRLALRYWKVGAGEMWRSISKTAFVRELKHLIPAIESDQLESAPSGVRAQAISPDGSMVDDFWIRENDRIVNVCNAPSPAATSSLNIGKLIVEKLAMRF